MNKNYRIHFVGGGISMVADIHTVTDYLAHRNNDDVLYIEDMDMKPLLDKVIQAMDNGLTCGDGAGLFFSYIGNGVYTICDPATDRNEEDMMKGGELDIRRRLQQYYKANPQEMEEDEAYIETFMGELA
jgi:hypothetical protein